MWAARTKVKAFHLVAGMVTCEVANERPDATAPGFGTFTELVVRTDMTMATMEPEGFTGGQVDFAGPHDPMGHKGSPGTVRGRDGRDA